MAVVFKHRYKSDSLIGTGTYKFRPYTIASPLPQLATPQNVTADGTTVSWDEVENATSYAVLAGCEKYFFGCNYCNAAKGRYNYFK